RICPVPIEVLLFVTKIVPSSSTVIPPGAESALYTGEITFVLASTRTTAPGVAHPGRNGGPGPGPNCDTYRSPSGPNAIDTTWRRPPAQSTHAPVVAPITQCTSREPGSTRQICDGTTNGNPRNSPTYHAPSGPMAILVGTACTVGPPIDMPGGGANKGLGAVGNTATVCTVPSRSTWSSVFAAASATSLLPSPTTATP